MRFYTRIFMIKKFGWDGKCRAIYKAYKGKLLIASYRRLHVGCLRSMSQQHDAQCGTIDKSTYLDSSL